MRNKWVLIYGLFLVILFSGMIGFTRHGLQNAPTVYLKIRPVDPRALLMGDYMALVYEVERNTKEPFSLYVGQNGIISTEATDGATPISIPVKQKRSMLTRGRPGTLRVPHQFYFEEGQSKRYERAVYAQMRHLRDGRFLLETLTDENLQPL